MVVIIFFMLGALIGAFTMCAMVAAGEADDREERYFEDRSDRR